MANNSIPQTPSQTVGPFFYDALIAEGRELAPAIATEAARGEHIVVSGLVVDGDGAPMVDAMVEVWQADAQGIHAHPADPRHVQADPAVTGFGRSDTRNGGRFRFQTVKPGRVDGQAPHLTVRVFARGMLLHANTRMYFGDEASNESDALLKQVPATRRATLIAPRSTVSGQVTYCWNIVMQGVGETVFFTP